MAGDKPKATNRDATAEREYAMNPAREHVRVTVRPRRDHSKPCPDQPRLSQPGQFAASDYRD